MHDTRLIILKWEKEIDTYLLKNNVKRNSTWFNNDVLLNNVTDYLINRARFYEKDITDNILELQEDNISYLVSLNNRFKDTNRIKEKIIHKMHLNNLTLEEAQDSICDILRYTIVIDDIFYTLKVDEYLHQLENLEYKVIKFKNSWNNNLYKSINVSFINEDNFKFEIQFHTPSSYTVKEGKLRGAYEVARDINSPMELVDKANIVRRYYQSMIKTPIGANDYVYEKNKQLKKIK